MKFFKKTIGTITTAFLLTASSVTLQANAKEDQKTLEDIKKLEIVKVHRFNPEEIRDGGSLVFVKGYFMTPNGKSFASMLLSKDLKTAVYGRAFDTKTAKEYKLYSIDKIKEKAALVYGSGKDEYVLVVDPLCPFCKKLDLTLPRYEKNVKMYVVFLPLTRLHPYSKKAIAQIMMQKDNAKRFEELQKIAHGNTDYKKIKKIPEDIEKSIKTQEEASELMGVRGTPSLYIGNGQQVDTGILKFRYKKAQESKK